jgi:hypothetical protein
MSDAYSHRSKASPRFTKSRKPASAEIAGKTQAGIGIGTPE